MLKICPDCAHSIAESARVCPHCGRQFHRVFGVIVLTLAIVAGLGAWRYLTQ